MKLLARRSRIFSSGHAAHAPANVGKVLAQQKKHAGLNVQGARTCGRHLRDEHVECQQDADGAKGVH